jgi:hypothetical protein
VLGSFVRQIWSMSLEDAYRAWQTEPASSFRDLDDVVLRVDAISDDGDLIAAGSEGTIVSMHDDDARFVVKFSEPDNVLMTALPHQLPLANRSDVEREAHPGPLHDRWPDPQGDPIRIRAAPPRSAHETGECPISPTMSHAHTPSGLRPRD